MCTLAAYNKNPNARSSERGVGDGCGASVGLTTNTSAPKSLAARELMFSLSPALAKNKGSRKSPATTSRRSASCTTQQQHIQQQHIRVWKGHTITQGATMLHINFKLSGCLLKHTQQRARERGCCMP